MHTPKKTLTLAEVLQQANIKLQQPLSSTVLTQPITGLAGLQQAKTYQLSFLANPKYLSQLAITQASAVLVMPAVAENCPKHCTAIVVANPYLAYGKISQVFKAKQIFTSLPDSINTPQIHPTAVVANSANIANGVVIGAYSVIGEQVNLGEGTVIAHHVTIADGVTLGKECHIYPQVVIGHGCVLGDKVTIHSHASIGSDGFGFAPLANPAVDGWQPIAQLGRVVIGNHVRIGSQTCVDRGALGDTLIEDNVIIDNLVQIAHNVKIGAGSAIAACVGISGSSSIGKRCILAGGVGLVGHIHLCDDVQITGMTMVTKSISQKGSYSSGTPMLPTPQWKRVAVAFKNLIPRKPKK